MNQDVQLKAHILVHRYTQTEPKIDLHFFFFFKK